MQDAPFSGIRFWWQVREKYLTDPSESTTRERGVGHYPSFALFPLKPHRLYNCSQFMYTASEILLSRIERKGKIREICFRVQNRNDVALTISNNTEHKNSHLRFLTKQYEYYYTNAQSLSRREHMKVYVKESVNNLITYRSWCHLSLLGSSHGLSDAQTQSPAQWRRNCISHLE